MSTTPTPLSLSDIINAAEAAIANYNNDLTAVTADQAKIASLQQQLTADQDTANTDGATAAALVNSAISALQGVLQTLPTAPAATPPTSSGS